MAFIPDGFRHSVVHDPDHKRCATSFCGGFYAADGTSGVHADRNDSEVAFGEDASWLWPNFMPLCRAAIRPAGPYAYSRVFCRKTALLTFRYFWSAFCNGRPRWTIVDVLGSADGTELEKAEI